MLTYFARLSRHGRLEWFFAAAEIVAGHFFAVADVQLAAGDHGMAPGLAVQRFEFPALRKALRTDLGQDGFALLRNHEHLTLVTNQQRLAIAIAALFPLLLAGC